MTEIGSTAAAGPCMVLSSAMAGSELFDPRRCRSKTPPLGELLSRPLGEVRPPRLPVVPPELVLPAVAADSTPGESGVVRRRAEPFWPL